jgi:hypothetical protein
MPCHICQALECIAHGIFFAERDSGSPKTACACYFNDTLYVTSQRPQTIYLSVPAQPIFGSKEARLDQLKVVQGIVSDWDPIKIVSSQELGGLKFNPVQSKHAPGAWKKTPATVLSQTWIAHCFFAGARGLMDERKYDALRATLRQMSDTGPPELPNVEQLFDALTPAGKQVAESLLSKSLRLKIVLDEDIFAHGKSADVGFHAESRVLRYLFIKSLRNLIGGKKLTESKTTEQKLKKAFKELIGGKEIHMGANRPACKDCADYMKSLGVDFESKEESSSPIPWVHPLYLQPKLLLASDAKQNVREVAVAHQKARKNAAF